MKETSDKMKLQVYTGWAKKVRESHNIWFNYFINFFVISQLCAKQCHQWRPKVFGGGGGVQNCPAKDQEFPPLGRANICPPRGGQKFNVYLPPQNFRLGGVGSVVSSSNEIRGEAPAENNSDGCKVNFCLKLKLHIKQKMNRFAKY